MEKTKATRRTVKKKKRGRQAFWYVIGGSIATVLQIVAIMSMWISGTFLEGMWYVRKPLYYMVFFPGILIACWFINEGWTYLKRH